MTSSLLTPAVADFLRTETTFAALTTLFPDGSPQTQTLWVDCDGEHVLVNTDVRRAKYRNVANDPRVSVLGFEIGNAYRYVEVRGRVVATETGPAADAHIDALSHRYTGQDFALTEASQRVILRIAPHRVIDGL